MQISRQFLFMHKDVLGVGSSPFSHISDDGATQNSHLLDLHTHLNLSLHEEERVLADKFAAVHNLGKRAISPNLLYHPDVHLSHRLASVQPQALKSTKIGLVVGNPVHSPRGLQMSCNKDTEFQYLLHQGLCCRTGPRPNSFRVYRHLPRWASVTLRVAQAVFYGGYLLHNLS